MENDPAQVLTDALNAILAGDMDDVDTTQRQAIDPVEAKKDEIRAAMEVMGGGDEFADPTVHDLTNEPKPPGQMMVAVAELEPEPIPHPRPRHDDDAIADLFETIGFCLMHVLRFRHGIIVQGR